MRLKLFALGIFFVLVVLPACSPKTPVESLPASSTPSVTPQSTLYPYPYAGPGVIATSIPITPAYPYPYPPSGMVATAFPTSTPYPQPQGTIAQETPYPLSTELPPASATPEPYPGPGGLPTEIPYPYPYPFPYPYPTPEPYLQPGGQGSATPLPLVDQPPTSTATPATPALPGTLVAAQPTPAVGEKPTLTPYVPGPLVGKVILTGQVTVWHSLGEAQVAVLQDLVRSLVRFNPEVRFDLEYIPIEALRQRFYSAAYLGGGPSLIIAPAEWGDQYFAENLVEDLSPYMLPEFRATILPAPLAAGQLGNAQISLPLAQSGLVLYRNSIRVNSPPTSLSKLAELAKQATRGGNVGLYINLDAKNASGLLPSLGGRWMDASGLPMFNENDYQAAREWLALLQQLEEAGGVEFDQTNSFLFFKQGRVGMTFADVQQRDELAAILGEQNLVIDPWPPSMGGWVNTTAIYLNANVASRSSAEHYSALIFIGTLLNRSIQSRLASSGLVPILRDVQINNPLDAMAYKSLSALSAPYPSGWDDDLGGTYLPVIDQMVIDYLVNQKPADLVLPQGWQLIMDALK